MNTTVNYLGLQLKSPLMAGASPMAASLDLVRRLEDAGAGAIVMNSLFEEQLDREDSAKHSFVDKVSSISPEAGSYLPALDDYHLSPDQYLQQIEKIKAAVSVPVIASLNGVTLGGWVQHADWIAKAGADAIELNVYYMPTDPKETDHDVQKRVLDILAAVKRVVSIPVSVKLSPFFTALPNFAGALANAGAAGLVLFNRFYQPDIDIEELDIRPTLFLSDSSELLLRLRWLAILSATMDTPMAVSGGVHTAHDAIKAIMAGASAVQMVSCLLKNGPEHLGKISKEMVQWLEEHEYESVQQMRGSMSLRNCADRSGFERANYMRVLQGWRFAD